MNSERVVGRLGAAIVGLVAVMHVTYARAEASDISREAGTHFRRGVELYGEANYAGALVEFKRAYALVPSSPALYDIGETQFQLQEYAAALQTFRAFLAEFGPKESHHAEVEADVQLLATRVGQLRVTTVPAGADIAIDDEAVGKTPFAEPLLVSVGHRKVVASSSERLPVTRYVDMAAGDDVAVTLSLLVPVGAVPAPPARHEPLVETVATPRRRASSTLLRAGWTMTGILAAGAATFGLLALTEANALRQARGELTTSGTLAHDASLTNTFAILADSFTAAAILAGAISLYWTLPSPSNDHGSGVVRGADFSLGPATARFAMTF
jgi:hypothetical protein